MFTLWPCSPSPQLPPSLACSPHASPLWMLQSDVAFVPGRQLVQTNLNPTLPVHSPSPAAAAPKNLLTIPPAHQLHPALARHSPWTMCYISRCCSTLEVPGLCLGTKPPRWPCRQGKGSSPFLKPHRHHHAHTNHGQSSFKAKPEHCQQGRGGAAAGELLKPILHKEQERSLYPSKSFSPAN